MRGRPFAGVFPTHHGESCVWLCSPREDAVAEAFEEHLRQVAPALPAYLVISSQTNNAILSWEQGAQPLLPQIQLQSRTSLTSGTWTDVTSTVLDRTINAKALSAGVAYPTFYSSTPISHVTHLLALADNARHDKGGVWEADRSGLFHLTDQGSIGPDGQLILPKLFRRATDYLKDVAKGFAGNLADWLRANNTGSRHEDDTVILPGGVETPLSNLLDQRNSSISFTPDLLTITFLEK